MIAANSASLTLDELIKAFRSGARQIGSAYNLGQSPERFQRSPERAARIVKMRAICTELKARDPIDTFCELMADDDRDIRAWAASWSLSDLPDLASATLSGLLAQIPTSQILGLIARAKTKPPKKPPLSAMTTDALVARFEDAGIREYATRFISVGNSPVDIELRNRIVREIIDIRNVLVERGDLAQLLPLLVSTYITVRAQAARATLPVAPDRALKVLEDVVASHDLDVCVRAADTIRQYKAEQT